MWRLYRSFLRFSSTAVIHQRHFFLPTIYIEICKNGVRQWRTLSNRCGLFYLFCVQYQAYFRGRSLRERYVKTDRLSDSTASRFRRRHTDPSIIGTMRAEQEAKPVPPSSWPTAKQPALNRDFWASIVLHLFFMSPAWVLPHSNHYWALSLLLFYHSQCVLLS